MSGKSAVGILSLEEGKFLLLSPMHPLFFLCNVPFQVV